VRAATWWLLTRISRTADAGNVREFGVYTKDHQDLISYLRNHAVTTIAMESTGTYWQTPFNALQKAGLSGNVISHNFL
jgi:transposase